MALHKLPVEILSLILQAVHRPRDLLSLILASAPCYGAYKLSPDLTLTAVLKNAILPDALQHALAILHFPATEHLQAEPLKAFLNKYFENERLLFPTDRAGLVVLCRLYSQVSYFVDDYSSQALRDLTNGPGNKQITDLSPLSSAELARFQIAFFRYELYSRTCPVDPDARQVSLFPAHVQSSLFLARIRPWEVEEMSCVHYYFTSLIGKFIDHLEDQFVEAALTAPGVQRLHGVARSASPEPKRRRRNPMSTVSRRIDDSFLQSSKLDTAGRQMRWNDKSMSHFGYLDLLGLDMFTKLGRHRSPHTLSYLASLGLLFIQELARSDDSRRKDMIRSNSALRRDFLPEAIEQAELFLRARPETAVTNESTSHGLSQASLGYILYKPSPVGRSDYLHITRGREMFPLRQRAYVFWDADRISQPTAILNLQKARGMCRSSRDQLYDRSKRKSAEERLKGVRIPKTQMDRLRKEFSSTFQYGFVRHET